MTRTKVRLEYIENDTARRVTYKKRAKGLVKKTQELSVLCGVEACALIYGPYGPSPVVWPSSEDEAKRILIEFKMKPMMEQSQRRFNQERFLKERLAKAKERLAKLERRNRELEMENLMVDLLDGKALEEVPIHDLGDLLGVVDDKLRIIQHRIGLLEGTQTNPPPNYLNLSANGGVNQVVNSNNILRGINDVMGERPPWEMEVGPSQFPSGSGQPINGIGDGCHFA